jgi:thiamine pyrophosphate-dependent acetolactate synthase large subunit-like protein
MKYAEAFGAKGLSIHTADQIAPVLKEAFDTTGPVLVGVRVDSIVMARSAKYPIAARRSNSPTHRVGIIQS